MRAIELYLRYDRSAAAVINELGHPNRQTLRLWHMEFAENGDLSRGRHRRYDDLQNKASVATARELACWCWAIGRMTENG